MKSIKKFIEIFPLLLIASVLSAIPAFASDLYSNNFTTTDPPVNWAFATATNPAQMSAVTFTAQGGVFMTPRSILEV